MERAEAIVAKLLVTADGVPVVPGMPLFALHPVTDEVDVLTAFADADNDEWQNGNRNDFSECYSTRLAALSAKPSPHPQTPPETSP
jgi:hypothetical protein